MQLLLPCTLLLICANTEPVHYPISKEMTLETLATQAIYYFSMQILGGALQKLGADGKDYLQRLALLLYGKFNGRPEIQEVDKNKRVLEQMVFQLASIDMEFRRELEGLVSKLVEIENSGTNNISQVSTGSGNNIGNVNVSSNQGNMNFGSQSFRN